MWELLRSGDYQSILQSKLSRQLLGLTNSLDDSSTNASSSSWAETITLNVSQAVQASSRKEFVEEVLCIGEAALYAFLQSNVTGPPLNFSPANLLFGPSYDTKAQRGKLIESLSVDGEAAYELIPNVELFVLGRIVAECQTKPLSRGWKLFKLRILFLHQRLLSDISASLQTKVFEILQSLESDLQFDRPAVEATEKTAFLLEKATIESYYGFDIRARASIQQATQIQRFDYVITGRLGKRTKFQERDISQLVVLAQSAEPTEEATRDGSVNSQREPNLATAKESTARPDALNLNDDTLLESISFTKDKDADTPRIESEENIPPSLASLDPTNQPAIHPLDAIILLSVASSITNTSPVDGLTREETLPYATRVIEGGATNWSVYSQALLVRSRIEGYKSRTVERGVLQLQALVDQVIAETSSTERGNTVTTFLPRQKDSESAPVTDRLKYIFQLASPTRWDLEAQLAARWVSLGGLRTALEIYERLEMWPEVALSWAAIEEEEKAEKIIRRLLFESTPNKQTNGDAASVENSAETWKGAERNPLPSSAPRLFCILGDLTKDTQYYERAWEISGHHYARAQRSLGRHYFSAKQYKEAVNAYSKSLKIKLLDHGSWFAIGCAELELSNWDEATAAFAKCVQIEETDAEAWTNLASALLKKGTPTPALLQDGSDNGISEPQKFSPDINKRNALRALKRAAELKRDDFRIWSNLMVVATSVTPPDFSSLIQGQLEIIRLRGPVDGERCIDADIISRLVQHIISNSSEDRDAPRPRPGLERVVVQLVEQKMIPLITTSAPLWKIVSKLYIWLRRTDLALDAQEKAWRAVTSLPGWEHGTPAQWTAVVDETLELVDAYETFGVEGWKFKARSAIRGVRGKGKDAWEGREGWRRLNDRLEDLRA
ncbi:MAG: hypothetical protein M1814_002789 [Vezdaea aestivalis]|nr:MAG: hypothetical protein M1814_002789 [Vezdaea aestivalis]